MINIHTCIKLDNETGEQYFRSIIKASINDKKFEKDTGIWAGDEVCAKIKCLRLMKENFVELEKYDINTIEFYENYQHIFEYKIL